MILLNVNVESELIKRYDIERLSSCQSSFFKINGRLNDAAVYLFNETSTEFSITVSHPIRINSTVTINIDRTEYGQGCVAGSECICYSHM
jgi:hypothetical protein